MATDPFERIGVLTDANVTDTLQIRLAHWRGNEAYQRFFREIQPQDRFIPGEQNEFVSDLDYREWSLGDMSGGQRLGSRWSPDDNKLSRLQSWYIGERGNPRVGFEMEQTQDDAAADFDEGRHLALMYGDLWAVYRTKVSRWDQTAGTWDESASVATGFTTDVLSMVPVGADVYLADSAGAVRKITDFLGTPTNASHVTAVTFPSSTPGSVNHPLVAYDGRLFARANNALYEVDTSTANTITLVSDIPTSVWLDQINLENAGTTPNDFLLPLSLTTNDKGPIWWVANDDASIDVWEYNVAADTTARIGRIPVTGGNAQQIAYGFDHVFVSFFSPLRRGYVWYKSRNGLSGVIGPMPDAGGGPLQMRGTTVTLIAGFIGGDMILVVVDKNNRGQIWAYDLTRGAFGNYGGAESFTPVASNVLAQNAVIYQSEVFLGGAGDNSRKVVRTVYGELNDLSGSDPILETGRWHFGYPSTYKTVAQVSVFIGEDGATGVDQITVRGRMDNAAAWTLIGTIEDTEMGAPKTFDTSLRGYELDLQVELTDVAPSHGPDNYIDLEDITARAITAEARREWRIIMDASNSMSAGHAINDEALYAILDDFKESGNIISFENPWDVRGATTPITYSRCRVADVSAPFVTESGDDRREIVLTLREVDVIGRGTVT